MEWLESFLALADTGSFTESANRQHLSQPAFSRRIRALENYFGADLVDRSSYPAQLTAAGQELRRQAAAWVHGARDLRNELHGWHTVPRGALRISTSHSLAAAFFPRWWRQLTPEPAQLPFALLPSNTHYAYDSLQAGSCDLLLAHVDPAHPVALDDPGAYLHATIGEDVFAPFTAARNGRPAYTLAKPQRARILGYGPGTFFGRVFDDLMAANKGSKLAGPYGVCDLTLALKALLATGAGVGWLPGVLAAEGVAAGTLCRVGGPQWRRPLQIRLYRRADTGAGADLLDHVWQLATAGQRPGRDMGDPARS